MEKKLGGTPKWHSGSKGAIANIPVMHVKATKAKGFYFRKTLHLVHMEPEPLERGFGCRGTLRWERARRKG